MNVKPLLIICGITGLFLGGVLLFFSNSISSGLERVFFDMREEIVSSSVPTATLKREVKTLSESKDRIKTRLAKCTPAEVYLIVNSADNVFTVKKGQTIVRKGLCSTGSYVLLKSPGMREWIFKTPRGMLKILGKKEEPVWVKPDWAFIEEGKPVPSSGSSERNEYGVLGDYALTLGNGYMIHGTLYQRFLGLPVSHGCIRMGDEDLKFIYDILRIGSKVYLY
jgi:L,D-transpeptidase YbiS